MLASFWQLWIHFIFDVDRLFKKYCNAVQNFMKSRLNLNCAIKKLRDNRLNKIEWLNKSQIYLRYLLIKYMSGQIYLTCIQAWYLPTKMYWIEFKSYIYELNSSPINVKSNYIQILFKSNIILYQISLYSEGNLKNMSYFLKTRFNLSSKLKSCCPSIGCKRWERIFYCIETPLHIC